MTEVQEELTEAAEVEKVQFHGSRQESGGGNIELSEAVMHRPLSPPTQDTTTRASPNTTRHQPNPTGDDGLPAGAARRARTGSARGGALGDCEGGICVKRRGSYSRRVCDCGRAGGAVSAKFGLVLSGEAHQTWGGLANISLVPPDIGLCVRHVRECYSSHVRVSSSAVAHRLRASSPPFHHVWIPGDSIVTLS